MLSARHLLLLTIDLCNNSALVMVRTLMSRATVELSTTGGAGTEFCFIEDWSLGLMLLGRAPSVVHRDVVRDF